MRKIEKAIIAMLILVFALPFASSAADFDVITFSCTPSEVSINDVFSCTAQIKNNGDVAGAVNELRLYPDSNAWLEQSNYLQSSGTSVNPGQSIEITFSSMRSTKSGNNGFARMALDNVDDTYVADNNIKVNVIDVSITTSQSDSSKAAGQTFTTTPTVTAGGNIDVTLTLTIDSGGCSIGNQASSRTTTGLTNQQTWNGGGVWTVTMGTSGACQYTLSAAATGANGVASKTSTISKTVSCSSGCSSTSTTTTSSSGGGGGGGGVGIGTLKESIGELNTAILKEIGKGEYINFTFGGEPHSVSVINLTEVNATVVVKSTAQTFTLSVGDEKKVDFESDGREDILLWLKSINIISKKATFVISPLYSPGIKVGLGEEGKTEGTNLSEPEKKDKETGTKKSKGSSSYIWIILLIAGIVLAVIGIVLTRRYNNHMQFRHSVKIKRFGKK